jgi:hypothetical protein
MFGKFHQAPAFASHWVRVFANCTPTKEKMTNTTPPYQARHQQQASQLLSLDNYAPPVISYDWENYATTVTF